MPDPVFSRDVDQSNYQMIMNSDELNLVADRNGYLVVGEKERPTCFSRWFGSNNNTAQTIEGIANQFFAKICKKYFVLSRSNQWDKDRIVVQQFHNKLFRFSAILSGSEVLKDLHDFVEAPEMLEARFAIREGIRPKVLNQTSSGTYVLYDRRRKELGIFKPSEQEWGGSKNPSWVLWGFDKILKINPAKEMGIKTGTSYLRERAAYLLDRSHFASVPSTHVGEFRHSQFNTSVVIPTTLFKGSFQFFIEHAKPAHEALGKHNIAVVQLKIPAWLRTVFYTIADFFLEFAYILQLIKKPLAAHEIHKIGIFDIRVLNCDRHMANLLIAKDKAIPIDHGLILPGIANRLRFEWRHLRQAHAPFSLSELWYIWKLDIEADIRLLKGLGIDDPNVLERFRMSTMLLKACAARGFTLFEIADLMIGKEPGKSYFENVMCTQAFKHGVPIQRVVDHAVKSYR